MIGVVVNRLVGMSLKGEVINYREGGGRALQNGREGVGASEVVPLQKVGAGNVLAILKEGHTRFWGCFNPGA